MVPLQGECDGNLRDLWGLSTHRRGYFSGVKPVRHTIEIDRLAETLAVGPRAVISLVGGGGKTTALFALGAQLPGRVVLTTTTKMGADRLGGFEPLLAPTDGELAAALGRDRVVLAWAGTDGHRALGVEPERVDRWSGIADHVVVEADGSRRRPFKAPAAHEPVVPASTSVLVGCVGTDAFGGVIAEVCHRPDEVAALAGCRVDDRLTPRRLVAVLRHPAGTGKGRPGPARFVVLVNRVGPEHASFVEEVDQRLGGAAELVTVARFG